MPQPCGLDKADRSSDIPSYIPNPHAHCSVFIRLSILIAHRAHLASLWTGQAQGNDQADRRNSTVTATSFIVVLHLQALELKRGPFTLIQHSLIMDILDSSANIFRARWHNAVWILVLGGEEAKTV